MTANNNRVKFVYFDVGNVLLDHTFIPGLVSEKFFLDVGRVQEVFSEYIDAFCRAELTSLEFSDLISEKLGISDANFDWVAINNNEVKPIIESHQLLKKISRFLPVGILSDTWVGLSEYFREGALIPDIDYKAEVYSHEVGSVKPEDKLMEYAEKQSETAPENILLIDDKPKNISGAKNRGWQALSFDPADPQLSVEKVTSYLKKHGTNL